MNKIKKYYLEILFILPLALYILGFTVIPIFKTILLGFQNKSGVFGLETYKYLFAKKILIWLSLILLQLQLLESAFN
ncbi:hypothetical protein PL321_00595 [Caloramator sp. mosi_1]|uniref:hypothetical protein n=1 Tax=Caloramator sp. mosi_1 TaxID=3023090 RepID=UPI00235E2F33|nr:hypothetical protein [Caloramator sp. mosi_1]WDC84372.1 hypothetical protein PL321_00595 [Caloramator sp. mosi_1]